jgi:hypothetical protein
VDTGFASPGKADNSQRFFNNEICPDYDARTGNGPGVSTSGDYTPPTKSPGLLRQACGTPRQSCAAVPL